MAGILIKVHGVPSGITPYAVLQKAETSLGDVWDQVAGAWAAAPTAGDRKISLTQNAQLINSWSAQTANLASFTGSVSVQIYDSADDSHYGSAEVYCLNGNEDRISTVAALAADHGSGSWTTGGGGSPLSAQRVSPARTWILSDWFEAGIAPQVVFLKSGEVPTLAMDFLGRLNEDTSLLTLVSVTDDQAALTFANQSLDASRMRAHFDITAGLAAGVKHKLTIKVTTTDSQTIEGEGVLEVVA